MESGCLMEMGKVSTITIIKISSAASAFIPFMLEIALLKTWALDSHGLSESTMKIYRVPIFLQELRLLFGNGRMPKSIPDVRVWEEISNGFTNPPPFGQNISAQTGIKYRTKTSPNLLSSTAATSNPLIFSQEKANLEMPK